MTNTFLSAREWFLFRPICWARHNSEFKRYFNSKWKKRLQPAAALKYPMWLSNAEYQIKTLFTGFRSREISRARDSSWRCEWVGEEQGGVDTRCGCGDRLCGWTGNPSASAPWKQNGKRATETGAPSQSNVFFYIKMSRPKTNGPCRYIDLGNNNLRHSTEII